MKFLSAKRMGLVPSLALACILTLELKAEPGWWPTSDAQATTDDENYAVANIGQLKNMVFYAKEHFEAVGVPIPPEITTMLNTWENSTANNFTAANIGQLKNVSYPFWQQLVVAGQKTNADIPWTQGDADDVNLALANIGQLKNCFNFLGVTVDPYLDGDNDGLSDLWEVEYLGDLSESGPDNNDSDVYDNGSEYILGSNPSQSFEAPSVTGELFSLFIPN